MKVVLVEDEKLSAEHLTVLLKKIDTSIAVINYFDSITATVAAFKEGLTADLIFMDIHLADGNSFEIFNQIQLEIPIIFTTAYDEYALRAFKLNSIDYLLKPIDEEDLEIAVNKFKARTQSQNFLLDFEAIKRMLVNPAEKEYKKRFSVKIGQQLKVISIEEVECFYSENKGTYIHTLDNRDYLIDSTLEVLEADINPKEFYRVSRKFIVPLKAVKEIQVYLNSRLKIILPTYKDDEVIVARERVGDFKEWIG